MYSVSEIIEYAKEHGLLGLLKAGVRRFIFHRYQQIVLSLSLDDPIPEIQPLRDITIRKATPADVAELHQLVVTHNWLRTKKEFSDWIAKGYPFFVAIAGDEIVGYASVLLEVPSGHPIFSKAVNFKDDDAWGGDAFVLPTYRGSTIYPALGIEAMKCAKAAGYQRILATASPNNSSARSAHKKIRYKEIKEITFTRILCFERTSIKLLKDDISDG